MKHVTTFLFAIVFSISTMAFAADSYRNVTFTLNSSFLTNYSFGGIQIGETSGTVISDPFSLQNPQSNSTDMNGLLGYMSTQPFNVQESGMYITYNVTESTNNALLAASSNYCGATGAAVELVDASNGNVLATLTPLPSFCGVSWLLGLSSSYTYGIPDQYVGKNVYVRLNVGEAAQYAYTSFPSSSLTNLGWSPFVATLLGGGGLLKQVDGVVAGSTQLMGNYPNPVVNTTTISVQNTNNASSLKVYDVLGRLVSDLTNQMPHTDGIVNIMFDASQLRNGIYFYRLQAADGTVSQRELIVKR